MVEGRGTNRSRTARRRAKAKRATADAHAKVLAATIREIRRAGYTTLQDISEELNRLEVPTVRGGPWSPATVARLLARLG
jgi:hypothetical protein